MNTLMGTNEVGFFGFFFFLDMQIISLSNLLKQIHYSTGMLK